jgi:very-short-patch-repair endonuclease
MRTTTLTCHHCGESFEKPTKEYNRWVRKCRKEFYCSQSCASVETKTKHEDVKRDCLFCGKEFMSSTHKRHKKCCSMECSKKFSRSKVDVQNIIKTMSSKRPQSEKLCEQCGMKFSPKKKSQRFCLPACSRKFNGIVNREKFSENLKVAREKLISMGRWNVWRKRIEPSYPEKFFMKVLIDNQIPFEREYQVGKYSIDFALVDKMIALEIDGRQHDFPQRKMSDGKKDELLTSLGWSVYRIRWVGVRSPETKRITEADIKKFLAFVLTKP